MIFNEIILSLFISLVLYGSLHLYYAPSTIPALSGTIFFLTVFNIYFKFNFYKYHRGFLDYFTKYHVQSEALDLFLYIVSFILVLKYSFFGEDKLSIYPFLPLGFLVLLDLFQYIIRLFKKESCEKKNIIPISNTHEDEDYLQRGGYLTLIKKLLDATDSVTIGINGPWGSGKTYLLNLLEKEICHEYLVIKFNPSLYSSKRSIVESFWDCFFDAIDQEVQKNNKLKSDRELRKYILYLRTISYGYINYFSEFHPVIKAFAWLNNNSLPKYQRKSVDIIKKIKGKIQKKLIIICDDLDRVNGDYVWNILNFLENNIKEFETHFILCYFNKNIEDIFIKSNKGGSFEDFILKYVNYNINLFQNYEDFYRLYQIEVKKLNISKINLVISEEKLRNDQVLRMIYNSDPSLRRIVSIITSIFTHLNKEEEFLWQQVHFIDIVALFYLYQTNYKFFNHLLSDEPWVLGIANDERTLIELMSNRPKPDDINKYLNDYLGGNELHKEIVLKIFPSLKALIDDDKSFPDIELLEYQRNISRSSYLHIRNIFFRRNDLPPTYIHNNNIENLLLNLNGLLDLLKNQLNDNSPMKDRFYYLLLVASKIRYFASKDGTIGEPQPNKDFPQNLSQFFKENLYLESFYLKKDYSSKEVYEIVRTLIILVLENFSNIPKEDPLFLSIALRVMKESVGSKIFNHLQEINTDNWMQIKLKELRENKNFIQDNVDHVFLSLIIHNCAVYLLGGNSDQSRKDAVNEIVSLCKNDKSKVVAILRFYIVRVGEDTTPRIDKKIEEDLGQDYQNIREYAKECRENNSQSLSQEQQSILDSFLERKLFHPMSFDND